MALMAQSGASLEDVSRVVAKHMHGDNAPVSMDACKTVLKVSGALDEQKQDTQSYNPVQINIIIEKDKAQPTTIIDVTPSE